ncbi:MAG: small multi-drug export protein [Methanosarcinaceae archaeon]|nr:small multi-drug export protein [Methanosarcinaceae archaeon]MDD4330757.1 small multi-drug export protein [Methanosarcinaceae archaeon]MDD4749536.1 small multi-drug export protein [Methanosarcinaceae archaeon]
MSIQAFLVTFLQVVPDWLATLIMGALPISELRGAIPVAIGIYGMDPVLAYALSVLGNLLPVLPLLLFLGPVSDWLRRFRIFELFFTWLFARTRRKHSERFEKYGSLALTLFVAVPLPVTGAWTGCAAAFVFGIKFKYAFPAIFAGVLIAGLIVTFLTLMSFGALALIS